MGKADPDDHSELLHGLHRKSYRPLEGFFKMLKADRLVAIFQDQKLFPTWPWAPGLKGWCDGNTNVILMFHNT